MATKFAPVKLQAICDEHKIDPKVARRKLRNKFGADHKHNEPWVFTTKTAYEKALAVLNVGS